ncbi:hypothetical protein JCM16814_15360 [Desulfobaculum senezii]
MSDRRAQCKRHVHSLGPIEGFKVCIKINVYNKWDPTEVEQEIVNKARVLSYVFWKRGVECVIHCRNEWGKIDLDVDLVILIGDCGEYKSKPYNLNILWCPTVEYSTSKSVDAVISNDTKKQFVLKWKEDIENKRLLNDTPVVLSDVRSGIEEAIGSMLRYFEKQCESIVAHRRTLRKDYYSYKNNAPLVSVIMATYNRRSKLRRSMQSVLNQSYSNIELIVVRDGGDPIHDIISSFDDERIVFVDNENNCGKPSAINCGQQVSKGRYICYLDDDDLYYPWHVETLVGVLENIPGIQFAYSNAVKTDVIIDARGVESVCNEEVVFRQQTSMHRLLKSNEITWPSVIHSREIFETVGGLDERLSALDDYDYFRRIAALYYLYHVDVVTAKYFLRNMRGLSGEGQITNMYTDDPVKYFWCEKLIKEKEVCIGGEAFLANHEVLERKKAQVKYYKVKGDFCVAAKNYYRASVCYEQALKLMPSLDDIELRLVSALIELGDYKKALKYFKENVDIAKNSNIDLLIIIAQCALQVRDVESYLKLIFRIDCLHINEIQKRKILQLNKLAKAIIKHNAQFVGVCSYE